MRSGHLGKGFARTEPPKEGGLGGSHRVSSEVSASPLLREPLIFPRAGEGWKVVGKKERRESGGLAFLLLHQRPCPLPRDSRSRPAGPWREAWGPTTSHPSTLVWSRTTCIGVPFPPPPSPCLFLSPAPTRSSLPSPASPTPDICRRFQVKNGLGGAMLLMHRCS